MISALTGVVKCWAGLCSGLVLGKEYIGRRWWCQGGGWPYLGLKILSTSSHDSTLMLSLSLDLFSRPTCCGDCPGGEVAARSGFFDQFADPFLSVVIRQRTIRESFAKVAEDCQMNAISRIRGYLRNDAHASSEKTFIAVHVLSHGFQEFEDRIDITLKDLD